MKGRGMERQSYWTDGRQEHLRSLRKQRIVELAALQAQLEQATDSQELARLDSAIEAVCSRYDKREMEIDGLTDRVAGRIE